MGAGLKDPRDLHTKVPPLQTQSPICPVTSLHPIRYQIPWKNTQPHLVLQVRGPRIFNTTGEYNRGATPLPDTELSLIDDCRGLTKIPPATARVDVKSIADHIKQPQTPQTRGKEETYFYLSQNLFRESIKTFSKENKYFVFRNRHTDLENFHPSLEAGYIMIRDTEGLENNLTII